MPGRCPCSLTSGRAFFKQRLRWSRNSYRTYLTAIWKGWLWRQPFVTQLSVLQILLTPVTMGFAMTYLAAWLLHPERWVAFIAVGWLLAGRGLRGISHLREKPGDFWLLPLVATLTIVIALPVKTYAFFTMNKHGWLTRNANQIGSDGQTAASLTRRLRAPVHARGNGKGPGRLAARDRGPGRLRRLRLAADDPGRPERAPGTGGASGADVQPGSPWCRRPATPHRSPCPRPPGPLTRTSRRPRCRMSARPRRLALVADEDARIRALMHDAVHVRQPRGHPLPGRPADAGAAGAPGRLYRRRPRPGGRAGHAVGRAALLQEQRLRRIGRPAQARRPGPDHPLHGQRQRLRLNRRLGRQPVIRRHRRAAAHDHGLGPGHQVRGGRQGRRPGRTSARSAPR